MKYSDVLSCAYAQCGGKSNPKFGDVREFAGQLSVVLVANPDALKAFLSNGRRRIAAQKKKINGGK